MFSFINRLLRRPTLGASKPSPKRRPVRLEVEELEDRTVPTVVFTPHFGAETTSGSNDGMRNPPVYMIFSGAYWNTNQGQKDEAAMVSSAKSLLNGPYLSGLKQYGSDGQATFAGWWNDAAAVPSQSVPDVGGYLFHSLSQHPGVATPGGGRSDPIYVVISDPASSKGNNGGWNTQGYTTLDATITPWWQQLLGVPPVVPTINNHPMHLDWVGTSANTTGGPVVQDFFTLALSHELAETISDPDGKGVQVNPPSGLPPSLLSPGGNQIGDYEPEPNNQVHYSYRLNGQLVQPYWSAQDQAFIVPDGNVQNFYLNPVWNGNTFTGAYNLNVQGDQLGPNYNDGISVSRVSYAGQILGIELWMNGETVAFDPNAITTVNINTGGGSNTVSIGAVPSGVTMNVDSLGNDQVIVSSDNSLLGIQGTVNVRNSNVSGGTKLEVDAEDSPFVNLTDHSVKFSGSAGVINYGTGVKGLDVIDGPQQTFVDVESVSPSVPVNIDVNGADQVYGPAAHQVHLTQKQTYIIR